jgi:hypothetical protein
MVFSMALSLPGSLCRGPDRCAHLGASQQNSKVRSGGRHREHLTDVVAPGREREPQKAVQIRHCVRQKMKLVYNESQPIALGGHQKLPSGGQ